MLTKKIRTIFLGSAKIPRGNTFKTGKNTNYIV